jgi:hypothetical protein
VIPSNRALEEAILELLAHRAPDATICVSEAARSVFAAADDAAGESWREPIGPAREAAKRLVDAGKVVITQGGKPVDPSSAEGPVRSRLGSDPGRSSHAQRGAEPV